MDRSKIYVVLWDPAWAMGARDILFMFGGFFLDFGTASPSQMQKDSGQKKGSMKKNPNRFMVYDFQMC